MVRDLKHEHVDPLNNSQTATVRGSEGDAAAGLSIDAGLHIRHPVGSFF